MDDHVFDRLTRIVGTSGSRRAAVGALLAATPLFALAEAAAKRRKQRKEKHRNNDSNRRGKGKKDQGKSKHKDKGKNKSKAKAQAEDCWRSGACIPKKGANVSRCNLTGYSAPPNLDCTGCNISRANLRGANLSGANLSRANLSGACLIDAILTGATIASTTNMGNAIICRTRMPDGSVSDAGCGLGTECCPVCDATHPCPAGQRCCFGRCVTGQCCVAGDCTDQTCKSKECTNNTCVYTNQGSGTGGSGCADPLQCCNGMCCPSGQKCCGNTCIDVNRCCVSGVPDNCPADSSRCCGGECILPTECCNNNQIGCPPDQTCVVHEVFGPDCCPTPNACGPRCRTTPCSELCGICNAQTGGCESVCEPFVESCCFGECKVGNGEACTQDADCCAGLSEICGRTTPSGVKICCREDDRLCSSNAECCSGRCVDSFCEEA